MSLATRPLLDFQLAHARARDAVHAAIDVRMLCDELRRCGLPALALRKAKPGTGPRYLRRPDLGRTLSGDSAALLTPGDYDVVFVIADGLSALAVERHALQFATGGFAFDRRLAAGAGLRGGAGPRRVGDAIGEALHAPFGRDPDWGAPGIKLARFSRRLHYLGAAAREGKTQSGIASPTYAKRDWVTSRRRSRLYFYMQEATRRRLTGVGAQGSRRGSRWVAVD